MIIQCNIDTIALPKKFLHTQKTTITLGNFDGVHLGHQTLLKKLCQHSNKQQSISTVITFEPHPQMVLSGSSPCLLTTTKKKLELITATGVKLLLQLQFTHKLANMTTEHFVQEILLKKLNMEGLILGYDFSMGKKKSGTLPILESLGNIMKFNVIQLPVFIFDGQIVSSSYIRQAIQEGDMKKASNFLGRFYSIEGTVIAGEKRGRILGFPTANLDLSPSLLPPKGVYATLVNIDSVNNASTLIKKYKKNFFLSVTNIGTNPTFGESSPKIETHLLDFNDTLYGEYITILFLKKLRSELTFPNALSLITQIQQDILQAKSVFKNTNWSQPDTFKGGINRMDATLRT